jgi:molybdopterin-containing oxidoreductase family iron-sulfur binding subunit
VSQVKNHVTGVQYWRSLEQLADTPEIRDLVAKEFPGYDADSITKGSRRGFLKFMGAAMALSGLTLTGCRRWPKEQLAPFSSNPEGRIPGVPEEYATAWEIGGVGEGLLVKSFDGRPIKVEGNQLHPFAVVSGGRYGASSKFAQASLLDMYDPQRSTAVSQVAGGSMTASTWDAFVAAIRQAIQANPAGFAVLSEATGSPSALDMRQRLTKAIPQAKWYEYEAVSRDNELEGSRLAFGQPVRTRLYLNKADVVVLLDADVLGEHPAHIRYASDWASKRRSADAGQMSRVYLVESTFSTTGSVADVRLGATPDRVYAVARAIAAGLGVAGVGQEQLSAAEQKFVAGAIADLQKAGKAGVMTAGDHASPAAHAIAHAVNAKIGAVGNTVTLHADPAGNRPTHANAIAELAKAINGGQVATLLIIGGNPAYDAPADVDFKAALAKVGFSAHLSLYPDETSVACKWHLPRAHYLECWGDARAWDGTASIAQPLIEPLFGGKSVIEVLALVAGDQVTAGEQIVRRTWSQALADEKAWRKALHDGVIANSAFPAVQATVKGGNFPAVVPTPADSYTVRISADPKAYDGRFANNGWMQETPDGLTKLVWDNAAVISLKDAKALGVEHGGMLKLDMPDNRSIELPAFLLPGQPSGVIGVTLGYGRTHAGPVGNEVGFNTYSIVTTASGPVITGAKVSKTGKAYTLVTTQEHHIMETIAQGAVDVRVGAKAGESGKLIREAFFSNYRDNKNTFAKSHGVPLQLFEPPIVQNNTHAWGMSIDMNSCTGCGACLVACVAENNIPVVGKEESKRHREMNWIRIDRYFKGDPESDDVAVVHQPMMCQHCENAPCEQVCPVAATVHDTEGLNTMVYNRCIGTRYCSNNCPYKVRRFNYFDYHHKSPASKWGMPWPGMPDEQQNDIEKVKRLVYNPDVTVRMRGVMEKCTYCVQRIHGATISKRAAGGDVKDGDILTACQQACATEAIVFGNYNEHDSAVSKLRENPRSYQVLEELNTRTRTRYLAKLRNPSDGAGHQTAEPHGA